MMNPAEKLSEYFDAVDDALAKDEVEKADIYARLIDSIVQLGSVRGPMARDLTRGRRNYQPDIPMPPMDPTNDPAPPPPPTPSKREGVVVPEDNAFTKPARIE